MSDNKQLKEEKNPLKGKSKEVLDGKESGLSGAELEQARKEREKYVRKMRQERVRYIKDQIDQYELENRALESQLKNMELIVDIDNIYEDYKKAAENTRLREEEMRKKHKNSSNGEE